MSGEILKHGLSSGKTLQVLESERSAVGPEGHHLIFNILDEEGVVLNHDVLTSEDRAEAFLFATDYLNREYDGQAMVGLNLRGMTTRPTFHIHGIVPGGPKEVLRLVFNPSDFLKRLQGLVEEFAANLKPTE